MTYGTVTADEKSRPPAYLRRRLGIFLIVVLACSALVLCADRAPAHREPGHGEPTPTPSATASPARSTSPTPMPDPFRLCYWISGYFCIDPQVP